MLSLRKYATSIALDWQAVFAYRASAVIWMLVDAVPSFTMILIWLAVYRGRDAIGGFSLTEMVTYYLCATILSVVLTPHPEYGVRDEVRLGKLSQALLKPISRFWQILLGETAWQGMKALMSAPVFLIGIWLVRAHVEWPDLSHGRWPALLAAVACAYALAIFMKMALALLSFWVIDLHGVVIAYETTAMVFQGELVPLSLLPDWVQAVGRFLPFRFVIAEPIAILQGRLDAPQAWLDAGSAALWALALLGIAWALWRRGLRTYGAVGG